MSDPAGEQLYLSDAYLSEYDTIALDQYPDQKRVWVRCRETIFYPEGGGQSADRGSLGPHRVHDVQSRDGFVWHLIDSGISGPVRLKLDWPRRYAHMQQHTGQHILSACFANELKIDTVSVHLGSSDTLIELETGSLSRDQLLRAQAHANAIIRNALPVEARIIPRDDLGRYPVRRDVKYKNGPVRLLFIGDYDCTGCGGTHVRNTAEVGLIKITGLERIRRHTRVHAKIGAHAYDYLNHLDAVTGSLAEKLNTGLSELPERVGALQDDLKKIKRDHQKLNERWLELLSERISAADGFGYFEFPELTAADLPYISAIWVDRNNLPCYFVAPGKTGTRLNFVFRSPSDSRINGIDLISRISPVFGLKGGGSACFITGIMAPEKWDAHSREEFRKELIRYINQA